MSIPFEVMARFPGSEKYFLLLYEGKRSLGKLECILEKWGGKLRAEFI
jgi:hypothetical protein